MINLTINVLMTRVVVHKHFTRVFPLEYLMTNFKCDLEQLVTWPNDNPQSIASYLVKKLIAKDHRLNM